MTAAHVGATLSRPAGVVPRPAGRVRRRAGARADAVVATDGVRIHARQDAGPAGTPTAVLSHGIASRSAMWRPVRAALRDHAGVVTWDQRGHGGSGWSGPGGATVAQTGRDLAGVLDALPGDGPVVLAGHSLGGMSILSLAAQRPELLRERVRGVLLAATSAAGLPARGPTADALAVLRRAGVLGTVLAAVHDAAGVVDRAGWRDGRVARRLLRRSLFAAGPAPDGPAGEAAVEAAIEATLQMLLRTPATVLSAFVPSILAFDAHDVLPALRGVPVTVVVGTADRITPPAHGHRIHLGIGSSSRLIEIEGTGHGLPFTRPEVVAAAVRDLVGTAGRGPAAATRPALHPIGGQDQDQSCPPPAGPSAHDHFSVDRSRRRRRHA